MRKIFTMISRLRKVMKPLSANFLSAVLLLSVLLFSCKKDNTDIGLDLVGSDLLHARFSDTATVITHTLREDQSALVSTGLQYYQLGNYDDPIFGNTKASIYTQ